MFPTLLFLHRFEFYLVLLLDLLDPLLKGNIALLPLAQGLFLLLCDYDFTFFGDFNLTLDSLHRYRSFLTKPDNFSLLSQHKFTLDEVSHRLGDRCSLWLLKILLWQFEKVCMSFTLLYLDKIIILLMISFGYSPWSVTTFLIVDKEGLSRWVALVIRDDWNEPGWWFSWSNICVCNQVFFDSLLLTWTISKPII